jgi:hypothetical protein
LLKKKGSVQGQRRRSREIGRCTRGGEGPLKGNEGIQKKGKYSRSEEVSISKEGGSGRKESIQE